MRARILTRHERQVLEKYLKANGEKDPLVRSLARYARENLDQLRSDLELLERFNQAYSAKKAQRP